MIFFILSQVQVPRRESHGSVPQGRAACRSGDPAVSATPVLNPVDIPSNQEGKGSGQCRTL